jgi:protein ImuB
MSDPPRLVTIWCSQWPTVAAGVTSDLPAAVFRANRVIARTRAAAAAGVVSGARRRAAQGACPELLVLDHDPDRDAREFEPVVRAVADMAPRLEVVEPGWLCLAARGPSRYFGGDQAMAERLVALVNDSVEVDLTCGVGVADGRSASAIASRRAAGTRGGVIVVPPGGSRQYVDTLSTVWLRELGEITPELVDLFTRLGLRTLGQLAALDPGDVLARFGVEGLHAHRLAGGSDLRPTSAADPPPEWCVEHVFHEPVEQLETVVFVAKRLADELGDRLAAEGRVCVRLVVIVETEHGERSERAWYRDHGMSPAAMVERVRWQLEGWAGRSGGLSGEVELIRIIPDEVRSDNGTQGGLWGGRSQADHDAARAIVRLTGLVGERAVTVPMWVGGRLPIERYRMVPAASVDLDDASDRLDRGGAPWPGGLPAPSPAVVLDQPVPIDLLDENDHPVAVSGRGEVSSSPASIVVGAHRHRITAWAGPWPVEQRWWADARARRLARFQVVTEQGVAHLVGVERQRWSILATYS